MCADYTGQTIDDRYRLLQLLGEGGMGAVYLGEHIRMEKKVAIKFLHASLSDDPTAVKRFFREAKVAARLRHPNIINVLDTGVFSNREPYLVMEFLEGVSLHTLLTRTDTGTLTLPATLGIMEPVLNALETAHRAGIVHRDLKPDNIFLTRPSVGDPVIKLIDFGVSKFLTPNIQSQLTLTGTAVGTPMYMSPEQIAADGELDHRADLYAVGVILYKTLSGELPFKADNYHQLLMKILTAGPIPPKEANPEFPDEMVPVVSKLLQKEPPQRYESAEALLADLKNLDAYAERKTELDLYTSGIVHPDIAVGNIGENAGAGSHDTLRDKVSVSQANAPKGHNQESGARDLDHWTNTMNPRVRLKETLLLVFIIVGVLGAVIGTLVRPSGERSRDSMQTAGKPASQNQNRIEGGLSVAPPVVKSPVLEAVKIQVTGIPSDAAIFYGKAPVSQNPFLVQPTKSLVPLKVTAPGYKNFVKWVLPDQDRTIEVALVPETTAQVVGPSPDTIEYATETEKQFTNEHTKKTTSQRRRQEPRENQPSEEKIVDIGGVAKFTNRFDD